jgi:group I intron endonuclease
MFILYKITNTKNNSIYIGVTKKSIQTRFKQHVNAAKRGTSSRLYNAMRKYGVDSFVCDVLQIYDTEDAMLSAEKQLITYIRLTKIQCYNILIGGSKIHPIKDKDAWIEKLKSARAGRTPALGMKHTEDNKKLFGEFGKMRWDLYGRYPKEVTDYGFSEAHKKFGISKTHYYRLRKERMLSNE